MNQVRELQDPLVMFVTENKDIYYIKEINYKNPMNSIELPLIISPVCYVDG